MTLPLILPVTPGKNWLPEARSLVASLQLGLEGMSDAAIAQARAIFPPGSRMAFGGAVAPVGWQLDESAMDRLLRVVSGAGGGVGGSWTIAGLVAKPMALALSQIPSHVHSITVSLVAAHAHAFSQKTLPAHDHPGNTTLAGAHGHTGNLTQVADHGHSFSIANLDGSGPGRTGSGQFSGTVANTSAAGAHTHSITVSAAGSHTHVFEFSTTGADHSHSVTMAAAGSHAHEVLLDFEGGGEAHGHSMSSDGLWRPLHLDVILCTKL